MPKTNYTAALAFVGMMFFVVGFALGINSFLIPVLQNTMQTGAGVSYLILTATFSAFLIFGYPASRVIARIGYKFTMMLSFVVFALGFGICLASVYGGTGGFWLFLLASFVLGTGNTFLQAAINPYVTILGPIESAARRISVMGICNKLAWPVAPLFLSWVIGKSVAQTTSEDLFLPFCIIIAIFLLLGLCSMFAPLPEVKAAGEDEESAHECPYAMDKTSIWQFPHLLLGALALFLYVGAETVGLGTLVDYASTLGLPSAAMYAWIAPVGMVIGYICGIILIPKYISQAVALRICAWVGIAGSLAVVLAPAALSIWFIGLIALGCSLMWPALWPLAMTDLGRFTKTGASLLVMSIAGGAVVPTLYGFLKDAFGAQDAYWICLPCFLYILYYGVQGYRIRRA